MQIAMMHDPHNLFEADIGPIVTLKLQYPLSLIN
jgi:hypothetical protein